VFDSLMRRTRRLSKIADSWTIAASLMHAWAYLKSFDVYEIDRNSCSIVASKRYEQIISDSIISEWLCRTSDWNRIVGSTHLFCMKKSTLRQTSK
jgi:hypothetical protein